MPAATYRPCPKQAQALPEGFEAAARGTVIVRSGTARGAGFMLGEDGLVMTAAHVVQTPLVEVSLRDGTKLSARSVRRDEKRDAALLVLEPSEARTFDCVPINGVPKEVGTDVYALGNPAGEELSFSLTKGIVSGTRVGEGEALIQTDASVSPGSSGGPLIDSEGRIIGVVVRKVVGDAVEGIGFGVPIRVALEALALSEGEETSPSVLQEPEPQRRPTPRKLIEDVADMLPSLDPEGDRLRAIAAARTAEVMEKRQQERALAELRPWYLPYLRWGGALGAGVGGVVAASTASQARGNGKNTRAEYESLRLRNDIAWLMMVGGAGAFTASFLLEPDAVP